MTAKAAGFPHSDIHGSQLGYQLPVAFRRFPRLSSPSDAETSTMCPWWLDRNHRSPPNFARRTDETHAIRLTQRRNDSSTFFARALINAGSPFTLSDSVDWSPHRTHPTTATLGDRMNRNRGPGRRAEHAADTATTSYPDVKEPADLDVLSFASPCARRRGTFPPSVSERDRKV